MECAGERPSQGRTVPPRPPPPGACAAQLGDVSTQATAAFQAFQKLHDKAYAAVQKGLNADEQGDMAAAEQYYATCLPLLDETLAADCENLPGATPSERDTAKQMQQKMNKTRLQISYRLESIRSDQNQMSAHPETMSSEESGSVRLPSYEEAVSSNHSSLIADAALGDSIMSAEYPGHASGELSTEGTALFSISDGVQIFHITREGYVSAPSYPTALHIIKFQETMDGNRNRESMLANNAPPAFIQVGDWFYPLIPDASPVLHTTYGAYLFPDLSPGGTGSSVGLMLPSTMSQEEKDTLEDILRNFSAVQEQQTQILPEDLVMPSAPLEPQVPTAPMVVTESRDREQRELGVPDQSTSAKISRGITVASKWISWGVGKGAEKAGELISYGSLKLRDKLRPVGQPKPVDPRVQTGMEYARKATNVAVSVSSYIVTKLGEATMALGRQVAPHIRKKGEELLPKSMKTQKSKSTMDGIMEVAASGLHGFGTVYMSLEGAAKALARSLANETVATVHHKYGEHASKLAENTVFAAGNIAMTAYNADSLGVKAIAKRAAKDTGKAVLQDLNEKKKGAGSAANGQVNGASYNGGGGSGHDNDKNGYGNDKNGGKPPM